MKTLDEQTAIYKALSETVRIRIVSLLLIRNSLCVCDLVTALNLGQSLVSRHLATLKNAKILTSERQGAWMHYRIAGSFKQTYPDLQQALKHNQQNSFELQEDIQHLKHYETSLLEEKIS